MTDEEFIALCETGDAAKVEDAIKSGADVNAKTDNGRTALMEASYCGHNGTIELLLKHGADVNAKDKYGNTALAVANAQKRAQAADLLLSHGASLRYSR